MISQEEIEYYRLRDAIRKHRDQKADDRCVFDDEELYAALDEAVPCDRRVGDKDAMLQNCKRFIETRCEGGGWASYAELEEQLETTRSRLDDLNNFLVGRTKVLTTGVKVDDDGTQVLTLSLKSWAAKTLVDETLESVKASPDGQIVLIVHKPGEPPVYLGIFQKKESE